MISTVDLVLTGSRAGKTVRLNGKQFVNGVLRLRGSHEQLEPVLSYYGRVYAAFAFGSTALAAAQARDKANGQHNADASSKSGTTDGVQRTGTDGAAGKDQTPAPTNQHGAGDGSQAGGQGTGTGGNGHEHAGLRAGQVPQQQQSNANGDLTKVREAVMAVDPDADENWTADGKPTVEAVVAVAQDASISRQQINAAAGDWTREQARAKKVKLAK